MFLMPSEHSLNIPRVENLPPKRHNCRVMVVELIIFNKMSLFIPFKSLSKTPLIHIKYNQYIPTSNFFLVERYSMEPGPSAHPVHAAYRSPVHTSCVSSHFPFHTLHTRGKNNLFLARLEGGKLTAGLEGGNVASERYPCSSREKLQTPHRQHPRTCSNPGLALWGSSFTSCATVPP